MTSNATVPSLKAVQAALRKTTEHLANELARPSRTRPDWSDFEWRTARAVAAMHGVSSLLATTLRWQGPPEWQAFLEEQRRQTELRHERIQALLQLLDTNARAAGVPAIALKGAALYSLGIYGAGQRPMADVDLLVRDEHTEPTSRVLESLGYHETHSDWRHRSFAPTNATLGANLGEHADNYLKIELHERICEPLPARKAQLTHFLEGTLPSPGLNPYPSNAALMAHLLLHAAGGMVGRSLRLLHLHDIALLARRMRVGDWLALGQWHENANQPWWAVPPLVLTSHYYAGAIPTSALQALTPCCPRRLRWSADRARLTDVSLSKLWIEAFPGIGWARSASEAALYIAKRIRPDPSAISQRKTLAQSEPGHAQSAWAHLNQGTRILRWLTSKPPRPATMYAVRASLDVHA
jgi:Uncharacterised nucleotidyltransferase